MIELTGHSLTIDEVRRVCLNLEKVTISNESMEKVKASREGVNQIVMNHETVYGINTGFGKFSDVIIDNGDQPLAVTLNEGVCIAIEVDPVRIKRRLETKYLDTSTESLDEAIQLAKEAKMEGKSLSI